MNEAVVQLPHLTDSELEQLEIAIQVRISHIQQSLKISQAPRMQAELRRVIGINHSLLTAVREARMHCKLEQSRIATALAVAQEEAPHVHDDH